MLAWAVTTGGRHADGTPSRLTSYVDARSGAVLRLTVQDDGVGTGTMADGHGISGMRERVAALGGALTAGPGKTGFAVRATIPIAA